jgi:hypothetical protein
MKKFLIIAFSLLLLICIFGCKIGEKAVKKYQESSQFAGDCADQFPPTVTQGETKVDSTENVEVNCDEIIREYEKFWEGVSTQTEKEKQDLADTIAAMIARGQKPPSKTFRCPPSIHTSRVDTVENKARLVQLEREKAEQARAYEKQLAEKN